MNIERKRQKYKSLISLGLFSFFGLVAIAAVVFINTDTRKIDERMASKMRPKDGLLTPTYVANDELYKSTEEIGGLDPKLVRELAKETNPRLAAIKQRQQEDSERKREEASGDGQTAGGGSSPPSVISAARQQIQSAGSQQLQRNTAAKEGVAANSQSRGSSPAMAASNSAREGSSDPNANNVLPPYLASDGKCYQVNKPELFSLVTNVSEIEFLNEPAWWKVKNHSDRAVSMILRQGGKSIFVAFIPARQELSTRVPASQLKFILRHDSNNCINWAGGYGAIASMPSIQPNGSNNPVRNGVFETIVWNSGTQIEFRTTLIGYTE